MNFRCHRLFQFVAAAIAAVASSGFAWAQNYPTRPITMIVGYAVGGPTDTIARILAERMSLSLGERVVIENVTGASGSIGVARVARAAPDGYMVSLGDWSTHVSNGAAYTLSYDLLKDFRPVALLPSNPMLILARKGVPADTLNELIAWLKAKSGNVSQGTSGAGSPLHIAGAYFQNVTGTHIQTVPYRGGAPAQTEPQRYADAGRPPCEGQGGFAERGRRVAHPRDRPGPRAQRPVPLTCSFRKLYPDVVMVQPIIVSDDLTRGITGKMNILGAYTSDIGISVDPTHISQLVFVFIIETSPDDPYKRLEVRVELPGGSAAGMQISLDTLILSPGDKRRWTLRYPLLFPFPVLRPGPIEAKVIHEKGEISTAAPVIILNAPPEPKLLAT
jgi:hypothetical protein